MEKTAKILEKTIAEIMNLAEQVVQKYCKYRKRTRILLYNHLTKILIKRIAKLMIRNTIKWRVSVRIKYIESIKSK